LTPKKTPSDNIYTCQNAERIRTVEVMVDTIKTDIADLRSNTQRIWDHIQNKEESTSNQNFVKLSLTLNMVLGVIAIIINFMHRN
jgi:hypothetical protein